MPIRSVSAVAVDIAHADALAPASVCVNAVESLLAGLVLAMAIFALWV